MATTYFKTKLVFLVILYSLITPTLNALANEKSFEEILDVKFDAPAPNYIISSEDIRRSGFTSIAETLRLVPGIYVAKVGSGKWAITSRGFNEQFSNQVLVMIDGRVVYSVLSSGPFWEVQDYILEDIKRIEVFKGPGGTIWGSNAITGVINIITKNALQTTGNYVSVTAGNYDKSIVETRKGGIINEDLFYRIYAKSRNSDSYKNLDKSNANDDWTHHQTGFRVDYNKSSKDTFSVHGDIYKNRAENFLGIIPSSTSSSPTLVKDDKNSRGANIVGKWNKTISPNSQTNLQTYLNYENFTMDHLSQSAKTLDIDFNHIIKPTKSNKFVWGLGYRYIEDKINSSQEIQYLPQTLYGNLFSAFIQDTIMMFSNKLHLTLGSKFEHHYFTGFNYQPSARLAFYPSNNQTIWASVSNAIRNPTRGERSLTLALDGTSSANGYVVAAGGNEFKSEELTAYEMGYRIKPNNKLLIDVNAFYQKYRKLKTFQTTGANNSYSIATLRASNLGYGESYGGEFLTKYSVNKYLNIEGAYSIIKIAIDTHANSMNVPSRRTQDNTPDNQFRITSKLNIGPRVEFDNSLYYVDNSDSNIDEYYRFDSRISYKPTINLEVSLIGQNLLEDHHQEFKKGVYSQAAQVPRSYYFKVVYKY